MKSLLVIGLLVLSACGKDGGSKGGGSCEHAAVWTSVADGSELDLIGMPLNQYVTISATFAGGDSCDFEFRMAGSSCGGDYRVNSYAQHNGPGIVNCADFLGDGTYSASGGRLSLCNSNGCEIYE